MSPVESSRWLLRRPVPAPRIRLYCFCYAGGNATSFVNWQPLIDQRIEICAVQLPGRGSRFTEKPFQDIAALMSVLTDVLAQQPAMPFAFFGHSLGALLAFELTRSLRNAGQPLPLRLFVSGCSAPRHPSPSQGYQHLDDQAMLAVLQQYKGTPPEILAHRELMELLLPTIRADFALIENYAYREQPLLDVPMTVLAGKKDAAIGTPQQIQAWLEETSAPGRVQWFAGGHFFIHSEQRAVLDCLVSEVVRLI